MTEENNVVEQDTEVNEVDVLRQQLAEAQKSIDSLINKKNELLNETKAAKDEKRKREADALAMAEKNGEFEKLWKQAQEELNAEKNKRAEDNKRNRNKVIENEAIKIAIDLAKDEKKAVLLQRFLADSLNNVADEYGHIEKDVLQSVRNKFETDELYSALRSGNQSVGSGATGNNRPAGQDNKQTTRKEFNEMSQDRRRDFLKKGGKLTD